MTGEGLTGLIHTARAWRVRPSELLDLRDDPYAAYCLDEACAYALTRILAGDSPRTGSNQSVIERMKKGNLPYQPKKGD